MSIALHKEVLKHPVVLNSHKEKKEEIKIEPAKNRNFKEIIFDDRTKTILNYAANGSAAAFAFFTFLSANLNLFDRAQEYLDVVSDRLERFGNACSGVIGGIDLWQKKNLLPFVGYVSMIPISTFIDGYNNWLARGVSIGLNSFAFIIDRREVVDENGEPIFDQNKKAQHLSGDFSEEGWLKGLKVSLTESKNLIKEIYNKPERIKKFSHATLITSLTQITGPIISVLGLKYIGSVIRNVAGVAGYIALLLDKRKPENPFFGINFKSPVVQCSILRIGTAFFDLLKRIDFFSERIKNLTDISLALDRLAGLRFTKGIFDIKKQVVR